MGEIRIISTGGLGRLEKNALTSVPVFVMFCFFSLSLFSALLLNLNKEALGSDLCYPGSPLGYVNNPEHVFCKAD